MPALPIIAAVAAVAGAATAGVAAYQQGQTAKHAAEYNSEMMRRAAQDAQQRGANAAAEQQNKVRRMIASQNVAAASNGLGAGGTLETIGTQTAALGELDALRLRNNALREAQGLEAQAVLEDYQGQRAAQAGIISGAGSLLAGAGSAVSSFYGTAANYKAVTGKSAYGA